MGSALQVRGITVGPGFKPRVLDFLYNRLHLARKFIKFCVVGGSGLVVDMIFLFLFADPRCLGLNLIFSKICAAEIGMINNFIWNELWTFRPSAPVPLSAGRQDKARKGLFQRFITFNAICGIGIGFAILLLHLFHALIGWNLYVSNLLAIICVTFWNFGINSRWNWGK